MCMKILFCWRVSFMFIHGNIFWGSLISFIRAWKSSRKWGFLRKWKSKITEKCTFHGKKIDKHTFCSMKIKMMDVWMQSEGTKLIFVMNFSVLDFLKFTSRMPQIAQILVWTFQNFEGRHTPRPPRNFPFFSLAVPGSVLGEIVFTCFNTIAGLDNQKWHILTYEDMSATGSRFFIWVLRFNFW